jgi:hypothetical protein
MRFATFSRCSGFRAELTAERRDCDREHRNGEIPEIGRKLVRLRLDRMNAYGPSAGLWRMLDQLRELLTGDAR